MGLLRSAGLIPLLCAFPSPPVGEVRLVSQRADGTNGSSYSDWPVVSHSGRFVAFQSDAANLVDGDGNGVSDIYLKDLAGGGLQHISTATNGDAANGQCDGFVSISADGRYVAFSSSATNLVPSDTNEAWDVFVKDRMTGAIVRASTTSGGTQANGTSLWPSLSADGRKVAFLSRATNLVSGDTNGQGDIFVKDLVTGSIQRVSTSTSGTQANLGSTWSAMDATGRIVVFGSYASNLVTGDTNGDADLFRKDLATGTTTRISTASDGSEANGESGRFALSADGRALAFDSQATNLVAGDTNSLNDVFVKDLVSGVVQRASVSTGGAQGNGWTEFPAISADGRFVAFASQSANLVTGDSNGGYDVFLRDLAAQTTTRISVNGLGNETWPETSFPGLSADGRIAVFRSPSSNYVDGDYNDVEDAFAKNLTGQEFGGDEAVEAAWLEREPRSRAVRLVLRFDRSLTSRETIVRVLSTSTNLSLSGSLRFKPGLREVSVPVAGSLPSGSRSFVLLDRLGRTTLAVLKTP